MTTFTILGDVHAGRHFISGVPLHRRGDREAIQWQAFLKGLDPQGAEVHVCLGDLFDRPVVNLGVIHRVARAYINAAVHHPKTKFVVIRGNHDASRNLQETSAFDLFSLIVEDVPNIHVVTSTFQIGELLFCGWDPVKPAVEIVRDHVGQAKIAFGHYDVHPMSDQFNMAPVPELKALGVQEIYTGHDHLRRETVIEGMPVHVHGSMVPLAHGEDADGATYLTLSLDEACTRTDLHNMCVRVDLQAGESLDFEIDCLQLQVRRIAEERESIEVELGDFDLQKIFDDCMMEHAVPEQILKEVSIQWKSRF